MNLIAYSVPNMNISIKSKVRHWFNFYWLAMQSTDPEIVANCKKSAEFYEQWGDISSVKFDEWWKTHAHLFHTRQKIEILTGKFECDGNAMYLRVPLTFTSTVASNYFGRIYKEEQLKTESSKSKIKKKYLGSFEFDPIEFQDDNFKYYFLYASKVYLPLLDKLKAEPKSKQLVELAKTVFFKLTERTTKKSREIKKQRIAPFRQDLKDDYETLSRTATRYRTIAQNLITNASLGIFPGPDYQKRINPYQKNKPKPKSLLVETKVKQKRVVRNAAYTKKVLIEDKMSPTPRKRYANSRDRSKSKGY